MTRTLAILSALIIMTSVKSQNIKVLHYTETSGFDHRTRDVSLQMLESFSGLDITDDQTGETFSNLDSLLAYDLVIFSNTSGDGILDVDQQLNFEEYISSGGHLLGIHAASDTYRHSTANGGSTGTWDFYAETLGGSVQQNPNHVRGTPFYEMYHLEDHPSLEDIPDPWGKNEEYYYWENGYLNADNRVILEVETTVGPNGQVNRYDSARATSWYRILPGGSRIFYTSLGHARSNFTGDTLFQRHIEQAIRWCTQISTSSRRFKSQTIETYPNPTTGSITVATPIKNGVIKLIDSNGKIVHESQLSSPFNQIELSHMEPGVYVLMVRGEDQVWTEKVIRR